MQSAYRKHHSTETILLAVQNDLLMAIDQKKAAVLVLLDLSAACDTQLLLAYSQLRPRAIHICDWAYVFTRIATNHVTFYSVSWGAYVTER